MAGTRADPSSTGRFVRQGREFFAKVVALEEAARLEAEREGLEALRATGAVRVPALIEEGRNDGHAWLLLEWLEFSPLSGKGGALLGASLATLFNVLPVNMMGIALGLHVRCGTEDCLWNQSRTAKMSTVKQIEQLVRIAGEFGRKVASAREAREIQKIGVFYDTVEESLAANGFAPNRKPGQVGFTQFKAAA